MTRRVLPIVLALLTGWILGRVACVPAAPPEAPAPAAPVATTVWTCSMHPAVQRPDPGPCPLCAMDLIPLDAGAHAALHPRRLRLSPEAVALAEIVTSPVLRRAATREVRLVGRVAFDDTRVAYITAWVPSRIDRLFVDSTGVRVQQGEHLVEVYSSMLITSQQELISAVRSAQNLASNTNPAIRTRYDDAVLSARERLRSWGLLDDQIDSVIERGEPLQRVVIRSPVGGTVVHKNARRGDYVQTGTRIYTIADLSSVWVELQAYETDLTWLHYGQAVDVEVAAYPGETFRGRISLIDPVLDDATRTVTVRVHLPNEDLRLKPDLFVRARVLAPMSASGRLIDPELADLWMCPMHPEVLADDDGSRCPECGMALVPTAELGFARADPDELPLVIPASAPLVTGERAVVYVRVDGPDEPVFEGREVLLGPRAGEHWIVREGLAEGERVVTHGAFKLDSELQLRGLTSMMNPPADGPAAPVVSAPRAFLDDLAAVVRVSVDVARALAADQPAAASALGADVRAALASLDASGLDAVARARWSPLADELTRAADALTAFSADAQRAALARLDDALIEALDAFGWSGADEPPAVFHCPMALDDAGAHWLDFGDEVLNPYFGASMLSCGTRRRTIAETP